MSFPVWLSYQMSSVVFAIQIPCNEKVEELSRHLCWPSPADLGNAELAVPFDRSLARFTFPSLPVTSTSRPGKAVTFPVLLITFCQSVITFFCLLITFPNSVITFFGGVMIFSRLEIAFLPLLITFYRLLIPLRNQVMTFFAEVITFPKKVITFFSLLMTF